MRTCIKTSLGQNTGVVVNFSEEGIYTRPSKARSPERQQELTVCQLTLRSELGEDLLELLNESMAEVQLP